MKNPVSRNQINEKLMLDVNSDKVKANERKRQEFISRRWREIGNYLAINKLRYGVDYRIEYAHNYRIFAYVLSGLAPVNAKFVAKHLFELKVAAKLEEGQQIRYSVNKGKVVLQMALPQPLWEQITIANVGLSHALHQTIGWNVFRTPYKIDFTEPMQAHFIAAGTTGSGKSNLLQGVAYTLFTRNSSNDVKGLIFDVEKQGVDPTLPWNVFNGIEHMSFPVITDMRSALDAVSWLENELNVRSSTGTNSPRIFVFIDELEEFLGNKFCNEVIGKIAKKGRTYGLHLCLGTQKATKAIFKHPNLENNINLRAIGKQKSAQDSYMASKIRYLGAERLSGGSGEFLIVDSRNRISHIVAPLIKKDVIEQLSVGYMPKPMIEVIKDGSLQVAETEVAKRDEFNLEIFTRMAIEYEPDMSDSALYRAFKISGKKADYYRTIVQDFRNLLAEKGYDIKEVGDESYF